MEKKKGSRELTQYDPTFLAGLNANFFSWLKPKAYSRDNRVFLVFDNVPPPRGRLFLINLGCRSFCYVVAFGSKQQVSLGMLVRGQHSVIQSTL